MKLLVLILEQIGTATILFGTEFEYTNLVITYSPYLPSLIYTPQIISPAIRKKYFLHFCLPHA